MANLARVRAWTAQQAVLQCTDSSGKSVVIWNVARQPQGGAPVRGPRGHVAGRRAEIGADRHGQRAAMIRLKSVVVAGAVWAR